MIILLLAILFSSSLVICFKYFDKYRVNTLHAILINYVVAALTSFLLADKTSLPDFSGAWALITPSIGLFFIVTFIAMSVAAQKISVIVSIIASKMSLIIPLTYAVLMLGETMTTLKLLAILLAMAGVILTVWEDKKTRTAKDTHLHGTRALLIICIVFFGSGLVDTSFKFIESTYYDTVAPQYVMMMCYGGAAVFGWIYFSFSKSHSFREIKPAGIISGIILGVLNYISFYFVLESLHLPGMPSTLVFPVVNVGVLLVTALGAMVLFHERLKPVNYLGVIISIISIAILAWQQYAIQ